MPMKKIIRKLVSFYIEPMVGQQNEVNRLALSSVADIYFEIESMKKRVDFLEKENERLRAMRNIDTDGDTQ